MDESKYPQEAQKQLKELRDAREEYTKVSNSLVVSDEDILNFDVQTATVINDKNEVVNKPDTMKRSTQSYTTEKTKDLIQKNKWWLVGGVALLLVSVISYFTFFRKGRK